MEKYFIVENGEKAGPFSIEELKQKGVFRDTLVWTDGLTNWTKAENIPMLKDAILSTPPPIPGTEESKTESDSSQKTESDTSHKYERQEKYFGYQLARRRERFFASLAETIIIVTPFILIFGTEWLNEEPVGFGSFIIESILGSIFGAILGIIFYPIWSGNLGHRIFGLKVISVEDGTDFSTALQGGIREFTKSLFGIIIIPAIWLLWDKDKQNLYDKVVESYVVKKN